MAGQPSPHERIAVNTSLNLYSILDGFHLRYCSDKQYNFIVNYLRPIPLLLLKPAIAAALKNSAACKEIKESSILQLCRAAYLDAILTKNYIILPWGRITKTYFCRNVVKRKSYTGY